jgi:hypothetical protein
MSGIAATASAALAVGLFAPAAHAASGPQPPAISATALPGAPKSAPKPSPTMQAIMDARVKAKATNKPVMVDALTTTTSETQVNPNGSLTTTDHAAAVRVKQKSGWATIDPTLHTNSDGSISPAVVQASLKLSGGGTGPLATVTTSDGKQLSVSAPFALPKPTLNGATATYSGVLTPDVDLQVTALPDGGWRDVIVVKTAAAAADPALRTLHFPTTVSGLTASSDASGALTYKDATGAVRLHAPAPMQWDSAQSAPAAAHAAARAAGSAGSTAASTADGPGDAAHLARIKTTADSSGIDLTPDQNNLGKGSGPWYIDPSITVNSNTQAWVQVQENLPDATNYNANSPVGTGYCGYSDCPGYGRYRAYFQIGISPTIYTQQSGAPSQPTLYSSTFYANVSDASSPGTSTPFGLYWTGAIGSGTTWNNQPCGTSSIMAGCTKVGNSFSLTGTGPISFDVTSQMAQAQSGKWPNWTVGIAPDDENNMYYRHHIAIASGSAPYIVTNYDVTPSAWGPITSPQPGFASSGTSFGCSNPSSTNPWDNVGWIGGNQNIQLSVNDWSPAGMNLYSTFGVFWNAPSGNGQFFVNSPWGGAYNVGSGAQTVTIGASQFQDGVIYGWHAGAYDANPTSSGLGSPWSPLCYFGVDRTPPTVSVYSTDFPPSGTPNPTPTKYAGQAGTFTLHGNDPVPAGGSASGVACYIISKNPIQSTGWKCSGDSQGSVVPATQTSFSWTPGNWGTNIIYVQAQDNAGNYSQTAAYSFYAPWNNKSTVVPGDVTGDGRPDIVMPDDAGNLKVISANIDPINSNSTPATSSPNGTSWNGIQITHRGSLLPNASVDDLIAHAPGAPDLSIYENDGSGGFKAPGGIGPIPTTCEDATGAPLAAGCPSGFANGDWSHVSQIIALGTPEGENNTPTTILRTSLVAMIDGKLWLFHSASDLVSKLDGTARLLSGSDWSNYDLINPGAANGVTPGTSAKQPTLWARNRTDGTLHAYRITGGATPDYSDLADPVAKGITLPGINLPPATYPMVGSSGDLDGDGIPDLWAVNTSGAAKNLTVWKGTADATTGAVNGFGAASDFGVVSPKISPTLPGGTVLKPGYTAYSANTRLIMQNDGNLVLYSLRTGLSLWNSKTYGNPGAWATMQTDGNFVVYKPLKDANGNPIYPTPGTAANSLWSSATLTAGSHLTVQDDCNMVIYDPTGTKALWNSNTYNPNP